MLAVVYFLSGLMAFSEMFSLETAKKNNDLKRQT